MSDKTLSAQSPSDPHQPQPWESGTRLRAAVSEGTPNEGTDAVLEEIRLALNAAGAVLAVCSPGQLLRIVSHCGERPARLDNYREISFDAPLPASDAVRTGEPVLLGDGEQLAASYPQLAPVVDPTFKAWAAVPLVARDEVQGVVWLFFTEPRAFTQAERNLMLAVSSQAAVAVARERVFLAERAARRRVERVLELTRSLELITRGVSQSLAISEVTRAVIVGGMRALEADVIAIYRLDADLQCLELLDESGMVPELTHIYRRLPLNTEAPLVAAVSTAEPQWIEGDADLQARFAVTHRNLHAVHTMTGVAMACLPLAVDGRVFGAIAVSFSHDRAFDEDTRRFLVLAADHCALAMNRAELFEAERKARALAQAAEQRKDEFLAMLGHELRNPLAPICTALELAQHRDDPKRELQVIRRHVQHLQRLVDDLLDVSRIARGKILLNRDLVPLSKIIHEAVDMVSPALERKHLRLTLDVDPTLHVSGDADRLCQVFSNILNNAAKYSDVHTTVEVQARREGNDAVISVRDHGVGIAAELMPRIFRLFEQGQQTIARSMGGLGIGLSVAKQIAELHGGKIEARSPGEGQGSTFMVLLPLSSETLTLPSPQGAAALATPNASTRVLVVDDNEDAAELLADGLRRAGFTVEVAYDGPAAIEKALQMKPDVVCLDIGLPVMDGYEVAQQLRIRGMGQRLIAITGYGQTADKERAFAAGFDLHFVKPVDLNVLINSCCGFASGAAP